MFLAKYQSIRHRTEQLCKPLNPEDYVPQVAEFASPVKWHLAHVSWFFEQMILKAYLKNYQEFDPQFNYLFNSYYQTLGVRAQRNQRGVITRPTVEQVYQYRRYVDQFMMQLLSQPLNDEIKNLIVLGLNHEQQHQELLITDLKYLLSQNPLLPVYEKNFIQIDDVNNQQGWLNIGQGVYTIGHNSNSVAVKNSRDTEVDLENFWLDDFCFDNEKSQHQVYLADFSIAKELVNNGDYLEFIESGGYDNFVYWLDEGWSWLQAEKICAPLYWKKIDGQWFNYTLAGLKPINPNAILCHVSFYEANAFACWKGKRLATEFEWEVASSQLDWGKRWEWTSSAYQAYPNFSISEGAVGEYNGKFMINQMVLRGASVATADGHSRATYRNFFHPQMQWQFSGIRLVK